MAKPRGIGGSDRLADQFRGYTVMGMLVVNFGGRLRGRAAILKHHKTYCSYADTIMPQFFLRGRSPIASRSSRGCRELGPGGRRWRWSGATSGWRWWGFLYHLTADGVVERRSRTWILGVPHFAFARNIFQALVHIAVTSIWVLPVIEPIPGRAFAFLFLSAILHVVLSWAFYYEWCKTVPESTAARSGF